jgi:hypothetical protein
MLYSAMNMLIPVVAFWIACQHVDLSVVLEQLIAHNKHLITY